jgi:flagellar basal-body rod protein FlgB
MKGGKMIDLMFSKGAIPALEKAREFAGRRHLMIVNNIANINTPYYKALDLPVQDFQTALSRAVDRMESRTVRVFEFQPTSKIRMSADGRLAPKVVESGPESTGILKHNENNVSPEIEAAKLAENQIYSGAIGQILINQYKLIASAISERISS